ncbi:MAG: glycosyltransferase family 87 protein [Acidiferrobacteraceae bacterium]
MENEVQAGIGARSGGSQVAHRGGALTLSDADAGITLRSLIALCLLFYLPFLISSGYSLVHTKSVDFPSFYFAAVRVFHDHLSPYGVNVFSAAAHRLHQKVYPYLYPPPSLLAFYPFAGLSYLHAKILMIALNQVTLFVFAYLLFTRLVPPDLRSPKGVAMFALFAVYVITFQPIADTFFNGQINLIVTTLILGSWIAMRENAADGWIAFPLVGAIVLKTYPALLVPLLWLLGRRRAAVWTVGLFALVALVSYAVLPARVWSDWLFHVLPTGSYGSTPLGLFSPAATQNQSLNGFLTRMFQPNHFTDSVFDDPGVIKPVGYGIALAMLGLSYSAMWRWREEVSATTIDLAFSVILLVMFMVAPLSWLHHAVFMIPAAIILMQRLWCCGSGVSLASLVTLASAFALARDLPFDYPSLYFFPALNVLMASYKLYAALALWGIGLAQLFGLARAARTSLPDRGLPVEEHETCGITLRDANTLGR